MDAAPELSSDMIRSQVDRLRTSASFAESGRLMELLTFVVEDTLNGAGSSLKESVIGNAVYQRVPPYDPRVDSTVRVEARRLRRKLREYYAGEGSADFVHISLPTGGYTPTFAVHTGPSVAAAPVPKDSPSDIFKEGPGTALAVLPFRSLSHDSSAQIFADGLTDEIIFAVGRAPGFRVTSRSAVFKYRADSVAPAIVAKELSVDAVLQGTVRYESQKIRVTIEVSDRQGFILLSDRFDGPVDNPLLLQDRISATLRSRVNFDSSQMRAMRIAPGPVAAAANAKIYRARLLLDRQTPRSLTDALEVFTDVAYSAPDYARGHSGMADCYCDLFRLGVIEPLFALSRARDAVARALQIDSRSVEAHSAAAVIAGWLEWDRRKALANFAKAQELGGNARSARLYGVLLGYTENHADADRYFRLARSIEPFSDQQDIAEAISNFHHRRFSWFDVAKENEWGTPPSEAQYYSALAYVQLGKPEMARKALDVLMSDVDEQPNLRLARYEIQALLGEKADFGNVLLSIGGSATNYAQAMFAMAIKNHTYALGALERAFASKEASFAWIRFDARLDPLRGDKKFRGLINELDKYAGHAIPKNNA